MNGIYLYMTEEVREGLITIHTCLFRKYMTLEVGDLTVIIQNVMSNKLISALLLLKCTKQQIRKM